MKQKKKTQSGKKTKERQIEKGKSRKEKTRKKRNKRKEKERKAPSHLVRISMVENIILQPLSLPLAYS